MPEKSFFNTTFLILAVISIQRDSTETSAYKFRPDEVFMAFTFPVHGHPVSLLFSGRPHGVSMIAAGASLPFFNHPGVTSSFPYLFDLAQLKPH